MGEITKGLALTIVLVHKLAFHGSEIMRNHNAEFLGRAEIEALGVVCHGDDVRVHISTVIINAEGLQLGNHVRVDPFCLLSATGKITLGNHIHVASNCSLIGGGGIAVEDFAGISHGTRIFSAADDFSGSHLTGPTVPEDLRAVHQAPVKIRRHAVIGAGAILFPGVTMGTGSIVGALSLVRENEQIPEWTIWGGIPAKLIRARERGLLSLEGKL